MDILCVPWIALLGNSGWNLLRVMNFKVKNLTGIATIRLNLNVFGVSIYAFGVCDLQRYIKGTADTIHGE